MTEHSQTRQFIPDTPTPGASAIPPVDATFGPRGPEVDPGLAAFCLVAGHYRLATDATQIAHDLGLGSRRAKPADIVRAARRVGLKARSVHAGSAKRLARVPTPAILPLKDGTYAILVSWRQNGSLQLVEPVRRMGAEVAVDVFEPLWTGEIIFLTRRAGGPGIDPKTFGFKWFLPSLWRYRKPFLHVVAASVVIQLFALVTPLLFQLVIDKVLLHGSLSTLAVVVAGLIGIGVFDVVLQYLRAYALNHTTSRIDVELGARLFDHLLRLPLSYFETRPAGQTVARVRELETVRAFLTGQGLSSIIDLAFACILVAVLFVYSATLTLIVLGSIPFYILIAATIRPPLRERVNERFDRGADSQQFLVESIFGIQTLKAAAVEPMLRAQWEEKLAAFVRASFQAVNLSTVGQNAIQYVSKVTTALILYFGALAVLSGELTVGGLIAFNMLMNQVTAPILRLSQLWQDFQQVQVSVERLGDILNSQPENATAGAGAAMALKGPIRISNLSFRYKPDAAEVLRNINLEIPEGQVIGIVGPSGSGKSTLTKLMQCLYRPEKGQITIGGIDIAQIDSAVLRRQIGVVLQENVLFNRTIHDNIAFADPSMPRQLVIQAARLAGADEFIAKLPRGYDTRIEERGANLSGGQRQRIAIARVLATQPKILILDEATSALDYESERIIQENMSRIVVGRTVIIIAHRLAAVRNCQRIIALKDGVIVEDGTHDVLIRVPDSFYGRMWRMQTHDAMLDS